MKNKNYLYFYNGGIGGFFLTLHLMDNIYLNEKDQADYYIVFSKSEKHLYHDLIKGYPYIKLIEFNKKNPANFCHLLKLIFKNNKVILAHAFQPRGSLIKIIARCLILLNPGSYCVGFDDNSKINKYLYSKIVSLKPNVSIFVSILEIVSALNLTIKKSTPDFKFIPHPEILSRFNLRSNQYIVIHPFAANPMRSLPPARWQSLISFLNQKYPRLKIVISGGQQDQIADPTQSAINIAGQTTITERAELIKNCLFFIGVDTGISHLACLLKKPSLIIGNLSNTCWLPTYNNRAIILTNQEQCLCRDNKQGVCEIYYENQKYFRCLYFISQNEIETAIKSLADSL